MYGTTESADSRCTMQDIEHAIDILNKEYSIPFRMYVSGYKYQEIADKMNIPLGTVKSRIFIARKKAQAYLTEKPTAKSTTSPTGIEWIRNSNITSQQKETASLSECSKGLP